MVLNTEYFQPASNKTEDIVAAENALQFTVSLALKKSTKHSEFSVCLKYI